MTAFLHITLKTVKCQQPVLRNTHLVSGHWIERMESVYRLSVHAISSDFQSHRHQLKTENKTNSEKPEFQQLQYHTFTKKNHNGMLCDDYS